MSIRVVILVGAVVACGVGVLPFPMADRGVADPAREARAMQRQEERFGMPEELRAAIPQNGPALPRPEVVRALRRQRADR